MSVVPYNSITDPFLLLTPSGIVPFISLTYVKVTQYIISICPLTKQVCFDQLINKKNEIILTSLTLMLSFSLCRSEFLSYIIFLLSVQNLSLYLPRKVS